MVGILTQGVAVAWRPCLPWAGMSRPFGVNSGTVSVRVHTENLFTKTRKFAIVARKNFKGCCVEVRNRCAKFHARAINHMWSLPSLTSPSEGIWSAGVSPASASRFAFITTNKKPKKNSQKRESISRQETCVPCFKKSFSKKENWGE